MKKNSYFNTLKMTNWLPAAFVMSVIFMFSSMPGQVIRATGFDANIYHVNAHFLLFFLLALAFYKATKDPRVSWLLTVAYAFFDEFHQKFVPLRSASLDDIVVDSLAGLLAAFLIWRLLPNLPKKLKNWLQN